MAKKRSRTDCGLPAPGGKQIAPRKLLDDLRELIEATRAGVAQAVNSALVLLYWQVGHRIRTDILRSRAGGLRRGDCLDAVERIGRRVRQRVLACRTSPA